MNNKNPFFDSSRLDELKGQIKTRLARPTLVDDITKQNEQTNAKKMGWVLQEIKDDPGGFALLVISALFTAMLGVYMGLTPHLAPDPNNPAGQVIAFNTDFGHVVTAILYVLAFLIVTEFAFFYSRHKFHIREETNGNQLWTMWAAMALAFLSIVITGGAGGTVVASTLGFLDEFKSIPASQQKYLVWVIPCLFGFYLVLHSIYRLSSQKARAERIALQTKTTQELEHRMLMDQLELQGEEQIMLEEIEAYIELVRRGKLTRGQARAAMRAGKSIPELEKEMNKDLDDSGGIGDVKQRPGLWVPEEEYKKLKKLYPNVPGIFTPENLDHLDDVAKSRRNSIIPWHCTNCDNWYVSDSCPKCGMVAPDLVPAKNGKDKGF